MDKYRFEYVKQQVDGYDYISKYVKLKKVGNLWKGLCPFHGEKTASFTVYPKGYVSYGKQPQECASFYCFGCGVVGNVINFKKLKDGLDTTEEACLELEKEFGFDIENIDIKMEYIKQQLQIIKRSSGNLLKIEEINLSCSSQCRNYLNLVKEYYPNMFLREKVFIDNFYAYLDEQFLEHSQITAISLIDETSEMINDRLRKIKSPN